MVRSGRENPAFESHLAKYRSLIPALALIYHIAAGKIGPVGVEAIFAALEWERYLESHARRIYAPVIMPDVDAVCTLAHHLRKRDLPDGFTVRDVYRKGWSGLSRKQDAEDAVETLAELKWLVAETPTKGGRPTTVYYINPRIYIKGSLD